MFNKLRVKKSILKLSPTSVKKNIFSKYLIASGFRRAMDTSNQLDFGLDSVMNASGFDYAGDGMNHGLPDFPIQFPGKKVIHP